MLTPSTYSIARKYVPSSTPSSYTGTMFGWLSATVVFASSTKRLMNSSYASSSRICFTTSFFSKPPAPRSVARLTRAMPPRASSRSSTYLPKTWGYIRGVRVHRSTSVLAIAVLLACKKDATVEDRAITAHAPGACAMGPNAYVLYYGLGDFDPAAQQGG